MLHAQIYITDLEGTRTLAPSAAFPHLQLFTRLDLYRYRRLLELSRPITSPILHVLLLHRQRFLKLLAQVLSPALQALHHQDIMLKRTQVHLSITVHLLWFYLGEEYHFVDAVTLVIKFPWSVYLFKIHLLLLLSSYADNSCGGNPEAFYVYEVGPCIGLKSTSFKISTSGSVRLLFLFYFDEIICEFNEQLSKKTFY